MQTHYQLLNVAPTASIHSIKSAYRRLALVYHPDRVAAEPPTNAAAVAALTPSSTPMTPSSTSIPTPSAAQFITIQQAYATLSDPQLRADYDQYLQQHQNIVRNSSIINDVDVLDMEYDDVSDNYTYPCRCSSLYCCAADDLERLDAIPDTRIILACSGCSLSICVTYTPST